jgi:hypothetical protein
MITNYARCTLEIKSSTAMAREAFSKKKTLFTSKWGFEFKEETSKALYSEHRFVRC